MPYARRIVHYSPGPADFVSVVSDRAVAGCWFELHRQGGCGAGELRLKDEFPQRNQIDVGDWIAFEFQAGDRWYFGRVEHRRADSPAGVTLKLEGMGVELGEAFPGGFSPTAGDGTPPHRYGNTDLFSDDPDHHLETADSLDEPHELVDLLLSQYVAGRTNITHDPLLIEASIPVTTVTSLKFRGEESVRSIVKELAVRARNASWGVDAEGKFFFLRQRTAVIATLQEGVDVVRLEEMRDRNLLFNRIVLTGGYVYDRPINTDDVARRVYRWRGNYVQPASRETYGERRIRLWVPWIRTPEDSRAFTREFFRTYADPPTRFLVEVANVQALPRSWDGPVRLLARDGSELAVLTPETIRVQFDHAPRLRMEIGPEDPHLLWPEPPHDERWEIPDGNPEFGGDSISLTDSLPSSESSSLSSDASSDASSDDSSEVSSDASSDTSSEISSDVFSDASSGFSSDVSSSVSSDISSDTSSDGTSLSAAGSSTEGGSSEGSSLASSDGSSSSLSSSESAESSSSLSSSESGSGSSSSSSPAAVYRFTAELDWGRTAGGDAPDLDLYTRIDEGPTCFFGAASVSGLSLSVDAWPLCDDEPEPPEIITGEFAGSHDFSVWYNQFSACAEEHAPDVKQIAVENVSADVTITVNGTPVPPGGSHVINDFAYAGYDTGAIPGFEGGTDVAVGVP